MYNEIVRYARSVYQLRLPVKASGRIRYTWEDKAGGYGIQTSFGMRAIKEIQGSFTNVMGLPIELLFKMLKEIDAI